MLTISGALFFVLGSNIPRPLLTGGQHKTGDDQVVLKSRHYSAPDLYVKRVLILLLVPMAGMLKLRCPCSSVWQWAQRVSRFSRLSLPSWLRLIL